MLAEHGKRGPAVGVRTHVPTQYSLDTAHCFLEEDKGVFFLGHIFSVGFYVLLPQMHKLGSNVAKVIALLTYQTT